MVVLGNLVVGRVQEEIFEPRPFLLQPLQSLCDRGPDQVIAGRNAQGLEVLANELLGWPVVFDEHHLSRPSAQCLNPHGAASGIGVQEGPARHIGTKHVEKSLAHLIGSGAKVSALQRPKMQPAIFAGNHSHEKK